MSANDSSSGILELGDVTPDIRPVRVLKEGKAVIIDAYVDGPTCPGSVRAKVSKSLRKYRAATMVDGPPDPETGEPTQVFEYDAEAWTNHLREILQAAMPDLGYDAADVLTGDEDRVFAILEELGYREKTPTAEAEHPNGPGEVSTTGDSSPTSPPATGSRRRRF